MPANDYVRARIDPAIKNEAANVLYTLGLTVSDACRMMLTKIAREQRLPFGTEEPNEESLAATKGSRRRQLKGSWKGHRGTGLDLPY
jgi:DNA-damage-inducible protein J